MEQAITELGLTQEQTRILFSYQYHLTLEDIMNETDVQKKNQKTKWMDRWKESCEIFLKNQTSEKISSNYKLLADYSSLKYEVTKISKDMKVKTPLYLILMETTFFSPYYPLRGGKIKTLKTLKFSSPKKVRMKLDEFADSLKIDRGFIDRYNSSLKISLKGISGFWTKLLWGSLIGAIIIAATGGFAAPAIGVLLAGGELVGAAASLAGLAALGGGAIATGGLGIAGGIAVVVGGGAILGAGAGAGIGSLLSASPDFAITQAAKLEVVMKEITLNVQKDIRIAQELIKEQRNAIRVLEDELLELKKHQERNKGKISNLQKSIKYLRNAIERNEKLFVEAIN